MEITHLTIAKLDVQKLVNIRNIDPIGSVIKRVFFGIFQSRFVRPALQNGVAHMGDNAPLRQPVQQQVRAIAAVICVNQKICEPDFAMMCDPFQDIWRFVFHG